VRCEHAPVRPACDVRVARERVWIDLQWLGVGRVRYGMVTEGSLHIVHIIRNANLNVTTYMTRATLPLRFEAVATAATNAAGQQLMICGAVVSEGGLQPLGHPFAVGRDAGTGAKTVGHTETPVLAIRLSTSYPHAKARVYAVRIMATSSASLVYKVYHFYSATDVMGGTASWVNVNAHSMVQYDVSGAAPTWSNGQINYQGYVSNNTDISAKSTEEMLELGCDIDGNTDYVVVSCQNLGVGDESVYASLEWTEFQT
jgi:hypothetical protein